VQQGPAGIYQDSPYIGINPTTALEVEASDETMVVYLMFRPTGQDAIWISVANLHWGWSGHSERESLNDSWDEATGGPTAPSPAGDATDDLATWSNAITGAEGYLPGK
jgi:hypothetical protein